MFLAKRRVKKGGRKGFDTSVDLYSKDVRPEFREVFANLALQTLIDHFDFERVLDIGSGAGLHADLFRRYGKTVVAVDLGASVYYAQNTTPARHEIIGNYLELKFAASFDCIWASHVLEHQPNANTFLRKLHEDLREDGVLAITVPPLKHQIVGGHVSLWNAGLLLYHLVLAGFDCRAAHIRKYAYNISIILKKKSIVVPQLDYDSGDIERLASFFPAGLHEGFDGDIERLNWPWK